MYHSKSTLEFNPEMEAFEQEQFEFVQGEWTGETGEVFSEAELMELTAELLEVTNERELNHFLGGLIKRAVGAIGKVVRGPVGKAIGGVLKSAAKKALPIAGDALGGSMDEPLGAKIGGGMAQAADGAPGVEAETLSHEDKQYEGGKQFVRFAGETVKNAVTTPTSPDPNAAAQSAAVRAAQTLAPGLLDSAQAGRARHGVTGRWVRRGRDIVILNA